MGEQDPLVRNKNFNEVSFGYTEEQALLEADRCLNCKKPLCIAGCPVEVRIPEFITKIKEHDYEGAYSIISSTNTLPAVCGRVCPQETQCEARCVRGVKGEPVAIGRLERFAADLHNVRITIGTPITEIKKNGKRVAIVGSGPAGLTCAGDLAHAGCEVTVFEAFHNAGGVLTYGIPEFRLPKMIVKKEIDALRELGVVFAKDIVIGRTLTIEELFESGFDAVFVGTGAGLPSFMNIEGESLQGVYTANEYLTRINLMKAFRKDYDTPFAESGTVAVVGGGNVAMDAARCAMRVGAEKVYIVYRRSMKELPARQEEVQHAVDEQIDFRLLCNPVKIHGDENGRVCKIECIRMELGEPDDSGRRRPVPVEGSNFFLNVDTVIMALGTSPNPLIKNTTSGLETNRKGCIVADNDGRTSIKGVFAGGDAVTGSATVIMAMGAGKKAAAAILEYLGVD